MPVAQIQTKVKGRGEKGIKNSIIKQDEYINLREIVDILIADEGFNKKWFQLFLSLFVISIISISTQQKCS